MQSVRTTLPLSILSVLVLTAAMSSGCREANERLRLACSAPGSSIHDVGRCMAASWTMSGSPVAIDTGRDLTPILNVRRIVEGRDELAITTNELDESEEAPFARGADRSVRTLLPLYPQIFFVIHRDSIHAASLKELIRGRNVVLGPAESGTARFARRLFASLGIDSTEYHPVYTSYNDRRLNDTSDICCALTGFTTPSIAAMLSAPGVALFSLDDYELMGRGSLVEGFCMNYQGSRPFIVPKGLYGDAPRAPVLTLAVDAVLVATERMEPEQVRLLVKSLLDHQQSLAQQSPLLREMTERFDARNLRYPLHPGMIMYLERNEPSFLERYIDVFGVAVSMVVAIVGGVSAMVRWNARRRKQRIDVYYARLLEIERTVGTLTDAGAYAEALARVRELRRAAFAQLIEEKLAADESFRIFIAFADDLRDEIERRGADSLQ